MLDIPFLSLAMLAQEKARYYTTILIYHDHFDVNFLILIDSSLFKSYLLQHEIETSLAGYQSKGCHHA